MTPGHDTKWSYERTSPVHTAVNCKGLQETCLYKVSVTVKELALVDPFVMLATSTVKMIFAKIHVLAADRSCYITGIFQTREVRKMEELPCYHPH